MIIFSHIDVQAVFTVLGSIFGGVVLLGLMAGGVGFFWSSFRSGKTQADTDEQNRKDRVDKTLSDLVSAQDLRYKQIEDDHRESLQKIGKLEGIIEEQRKQQLWFEGIFIDALNKYFADNPGLAVELNGKLKHTRSR